MGYPDDLIETASPRFFESFCGVGNPFSLGEIRYGEAVLDFGCGAGLDLFVAANLVGEKGRVCGVDLTEAMVLKARENLELAGIRNIEIKQVDSEFIPYDDRFFDAVISNGVINLSQDKPNCFKEVHRVLKQGGRLQFADIVLENELPGSFKESAEAWSQ